MKTILKKLSVLLIIALGMCCSIQLLPDCHCTEDLLNHIKIDCIVQNCFEHLSEAKLFVETDYAQCRQCSHQAFKKYTFSVNSQDQRREFKAVFPIEKLEPLRITALLFTQKIPTRNIPIYPFTETLRTVIIRS